MAFYRDRGLKELGNELGSDGIGIGGGFIVGGLIGRQAETMLIKTPVTETSTIANKAMAWAANNGAKAVLYLIAKHYDARSPLTKEATSALAGSMVYDTILRLANKGVNIADVTLAGYKIMGQGGQPENVQKLVQENGILRTELNKALQKLAGVNNMIPPSPDSSADFKYGGSPSPAVLERQRRFGAMPYTPDVMERQRRYGAMPFQQDQAKTGRQSRFGFMADEKMATSSVGKTFGML